MSDDTLDPIMTAAIDLIGRTGAESFTLRYSEEEGQPTIWIAFALWPVANGGYTVMSGSSMQPVLAVLDLAEKITDGGTCTHCGRVTIFEADWTKPTLPPLTLGGQQLEHCNIQYDPELNTFRRQCEGET